MTDRELADKLQSAYGTRNGWFGPSFADQFRNAGDSIDELNRLNAAGEFEGNQGQYDRYSALLKGQQGQAVAGGIIAGLGGLTNIASTAIGLADINDTQQYQNQIDSLGEIGNTDYNSYDQLAMDYARLRSSQPQFSYQDIRGKTDLEKAGGVLSAGLSGASTGLQIGGPWGALIGGVAGLGAGAIGWLEGDRKAKSEQRRLRQNAMVANDTAQINLDAAGERMLDRGHRYQMQNVAREGGSLRKQETIEQFASRVLRKPKQRSASPSNRIVHQHCAGGTMIRFKK
jgi:hypothetical protein